MTTPVDPKRPTETVGEAAWNTFRAVVLAALICLVAVVALMGWATNRPADTTDWSQFNTPTNTQRY
jgi:ABC-type Fe3+ transport system permease subunit